MTVSQALFQGLQVTGVGLIIVFSVLIVLMLVMIAMKAIFYKPEKNEEKALKTPEANPPVNVNKSDDEELIAVITAAISAYAEKNASSLKVKSFKRINNNISAWKKAGSDVTNSKF